MKTKQHRSKIINAMHDANIASQGELARQSGISARTINDLITINSSPIAKSGEWRQTALKLAKFFQTEPALLFQSDDEYVDVNLILDYDTPDVEYEKVERKIIIDKVVNSLSTCQIKILKMRFWDNKTLEDIGDKLGITREGVRQLEVKALRKLRHPSRLKILEGLHYYGT